MRVWFNDQALLNNIRTYRTNNPETVVIVVLFSGRPVSVQDYLNSWDAFVAAWLPGTEGGPAIVDVLFGNKDFVGRTPFTWRTTYLRNITPPHFPTGEVLYPYGHGLTKN